jgi:hypothetical protein
MPFDGPKKELKKKYIKLIVNGKIIQQGWRGSLLWEIAILSST